MRPHPHTHDPDAGPAFLAGRSVGNGQARGARHGDGALARLRNRKAVYRNVGRAVQVERVSAARDRDVFDRSALQLRKRLSIPDGRKFECAHTCAAED